MFALLPRERVGKMEIRKSGERWKKLNKREKEDSETEDFEITMNTIFIVILCSVILLIVIYLLAIMPRILNRPDKSEFMNRLYAHRGLHDNTTDAPENSLRAFQKAVDAGFGIELDIQLTKDDIPVVFHDFTMKRICGAEGRVRDYSYRELQQFTLCGSDQRIPGFEEVLRLVEGKVPLIVEFKIEGMELSLCPIADKLLREYKGAYCIESFHPLCVRWYRKHHKEVMRGQLSHAFLKEGGENRILDFALQNLLFNFLTKPDFIAYDHKQQKVLSRRLCRGLYRSPAVAWTIKSREELEEAGKHFDLFIFDSFIP